MKKRKAEMREEMKAQQLGQQSVVPVSNEVEKDKTEIEQEIHENFFRANSIQEKKTNLFQSISAYKQQELLNKEYMEALQQASSPGKKDEWKTVSSKKSVKKVEVPAASVPVPIVKSKKAIKQTKKPKDLQAIRIKLEQEFDNWTRHVLVKVNASIDGKREMFRFFIN